MCASVNVICSYLKYLGFTEYWAFCACTRIRVFVCASATPYLYPLFLSPSTRSSYIYYRSLYSATRSKVLWTRSASNNNGVFLASGKSLEVMSAAVDGQSSKGEENQIPRWRPRRRTWNTSTCNVRIIRNAIMKVLSYGNNVKSQSLRINGLHLIVLSRDFYI